MTSLSIQDQERVPLILSPQTAGIEEGASDLFFVQNATQWNGNMSPALTSLFEIMDEQGLHFFQTAENMDGLIASDDVIILKSNAQWSNRGGTNTDLIKALIEVILNHPEGFIGEIVVGDNGQNYGSMDWSSANSFHRNQSVQEVVDLFPTSNVSAFLWDTLKTHNVDEFSEGDFDDGYVLESTWHADTEIYVSYPKFTSEHGTRISLKNGIWEGDSTYNADRIKLINMPVLKSHGVYGVTGCVKNYMGFVMGHVTDNPYDIPHEHFAIAQGGLATIMGEVRYPVLNILDATWINPNPVESASNHGPRCYYWDASFTDILGASTDPVAMDYWTSKNILIPTAEYENYTEFASLDPDYAPLVTPHPQAWCFPYESFHNYLTRSMNELIDYGYQVTMNTTEMNVFVSVAPQISPPTTSTTTTSTTTSTSTTTTTTEDLPLNPVLIGALVGGSIILIVAVAYMKKR
jgi:uncharacterized protein (DUF362 family)